MSLEVIAIDGPAASGKSTVASHLAGLLSIAYINTGSMFRAVAYLLQKNNISLDDIQGIMNLLNSVKFEYKLDENKQYKIYVDNQKLDSELTSKEVVSQVSLVATISEVRDFLKAFQREIAKSEMVVMEGRDIGSVVFPDAKWKFFVTATPEIRAKRRLDQNANGYSAEELKEVAKSIAMRDEIDSNRAIAPLKKCDDATLVDTSNMNIDEVVNFIKEKIGR